MKIDINKLSKDATVSTEEAETTINWDYQTKTVTFFTTRLSEMKNLIKRINPHQILDFEENEASWMLKAEMEAFGKPFRASKLRNKL